MGQTNNIVEINGKRYDAVTGAIIRDTRSAGKPAKAVHAKPHQLSHRSMDGFARVSRDAALKPSFSKPAALSAAQSRAPRAAASHARVHKPQKAVTLMRTAVRKPDVKAASVIKAQTRTDLLAQAPVHTVAAKHSFNSINKHRHQRAERLERSPKVSHFSTPAPVAVAVPVAAPQPTVKQSASQALDFIATRRTHSQAAPIAKQHHSAPANKSRSSEIFENALATATSHEQTFDEVKQPRSRSHSRRKRAFGYVVASFAFLLVVGFFGYSQADQISLQVASYRSGLHAKLPTYQPGDYELKELTYKPGNVTVSFASATGGESYSISQRASNWDSQALLSNVMATAKNNYKTYQQAGRTIYVLGNKSATWVDSGILYTVGGNANLSSSQLLDLASSM